MGIDVYLLNRHNAILEIGGLRKKVGTLRQLCKLSEMTAWRRNQMQVCHEALQGMRLPVAVLAWTVGIRPVDASNTDDDGYAVLAWEPNRSSVNVLNSDYLPILGYAVMSKCRDYYILHEIRDKIAVPVTLESAKEKGIIDSRNRFLRLSPPTILRYTSITKSSFSMSSIAECVFSDGQTGDVWTRIEDEKLPSEDWYIGKKPGETRYFYYT